MTVRSSSVQGHQGPNTFDPIFESIKRTYHVHSIKYRFDCYEHANGEFIECEHAESDQCTCIEEEPAPSERNRDEECPACQAAAAASTEPESEPSATVESVRGPGPALDWYK
jgi:hypothetical protein